MSTTKSVRLNDDLDELVEAMPRGAFSLVANRLLHLYFSDEDIRARVDSMQIAPAPAKPAVDPAEAQKQRNKAEIEAAVAAPAAPEPDHTTIHTENFHPDLANDAKEFLEHKSEPKLEPKLESPEPVEEELPTPVEKPVEKVTVKQPETYSLLDSILPS